MHPKKRPAILPLTKEQLELKIAAYEEKLSKARKDIKSAETEDQKSLINDAIVYYKAMLVKLNTELASLVLYPKF